LRIGNKKNGEDAANGGLLRLLRSQRRQTRRVFQKFKIALPAHAGCAKEVLDDKQWNGVVRRDYNRAPGTGFGVDQVVAFLAMVPKSILLEDANEALEVHRPESGHLLLDAHRETIHGHELRSAPIVPVLLVAGFAQDLVQRSHVGARSKKPPDGVADVAAGFLVGRAAA